MLKLRSLIALIIPVHCVAKNGVGFGLENAYVMLVPISYQSSCLINYPRVLHTWWTIVKKTKVSRTSAPFAKVEITKLLTKSQK